MCSKEGTGKNLSLLFCLTLVNFFIFLIYITYICLKKYSIKIIAYNENLTVRVRLIILTVVGLALTMAIWGFIQLTALDRILVDQQAKRLEGVADTISTFYQFFPTKRGLLALDSALKDFIQTDVRLARIDIFDTSHGNVDYVAGASRVQYEWPDNIVAAASAKGKVRYVKIDTESGPALGLLYPVSGETKDSHIVVGIIGFSRANAEIMNQCPTIAYFQQHRIITVHPFGTGIKLWLDHRQTAESDHSDN